MGFPSLNQPLEASLFFMVQLEKFTKLHLKFSQNYPEVTHKTDVGVENTREIMQAP